MGTNGNSGHLKDNLLLDDERTFEFVFKAYFPRLMAFIIKFIPDKVEAEDVIQDAFLKLWLKRKEIKEDTFHSYLFTMVRNVCLNHIKHQKVTSNYKLTLERRIKGEELYYADFFSDPFHQTIFNELRGVIEGIMNNFPEQTKNVFYLSRFKGMKNTEIAARLNITLRTVEKHNTKALQLLKDHFPSNYALCVAVIYLVGKVL